MPKLFSVRKPRLRLSKRGKVSLSGGGVSLGGRAGRVNLSKSGASYSVGGKHLRYNSRRGTQCGFVFLLILGAVAAGVGAAGIALTSLLT